MTALNSFRSGPDDKGHFGLFGGRYVAVRLGLDKGERDWSAPQDHVIPVWMDSGARQRVVYRNGAFLLTQCQLAAREAGRPEAPSEEQHISPAYVLDEATGRREALVDRRDLMAVKVATDGLGTRGVVGGS